MTWPFLIKYSTKIPTKLMGLVRYSSMDTLKSADPLIHSQYLKFGFTELVSEAQNEKTKKMHRKRKHAWCYGTKSKKEITFEMALSSTFFHKILDRVKLQFLQSTGSTYVAVLFIIVCTSSKKPLSSLENFNTMQTVELTH